MYKKYGKNKYSFNACKATCRLKDNYTQQCTYENYGLAFIV